MELTRRGGEDLLSSIRLPTVWNQIEAAMAHMHEIPLLVIAERGLREEGLLGMSFGQILVHQSLRQMRSKVFLKLGRMRFQKKRKLNQHKLSANNLIYLKYQYSNYFLI